jgi:HAD superfamily hydrolase (TIGR01509 family)
MVSRSLDRPEALIFDLDGTLVDTVPTRIEAWLATFAEFSIPADRAFVASLIGADGKFVADQVAAAAGRQLADGEDARIDRRSGTRYSSLNTDPRPLPGARDFLIQLDTAGLPWAIATSSLAAQTTTSVASLHLERAPVIVDGTRVLRAKPAPDLLLAAAMELEREPAACWYIGDSTWDMLAASRAGMVAIGVTTGTASVDELSTAGAGVVAATLDEIRGWL